MEDITVSYGNQSRL